MRYKGTDGALRCSRRGVQAMHVVARGRRRGVSPVYVKGPHGQAVTR